MRAGAGRDGVVPEPLDIPCKMLNETQKNKLLALASQWFDLIPPRHARAQKKRFVDTLDETRFSWSGQLAAGSDVSYAIQGPSVIMEYANDALGGSAGGAPRTTCTRATAILSANTAAGSSAVPVDRGDEGQSIMNDLRQSVSEIRANYNESAFALITSIEQQTLNITQKND